MFYRIEKSASPDKLVISDVQFAEEKLAEGYNERKGTQVFIEMPITEFLGRLAMGIMSRQSIAKFEVNREGRCEIEWLERTESNAILHRDVIELTFDDGLVNELSFLTAMFHIFREKSRKNVLSKLLKNENREDIFLQCWDALVNFKDGHSLDKYDEKDITRMYHYIREHLHYFDFCPVVPNTKLSNVRKSNMFIKVAMVFLSLGFIRAILLGDFIRIVSIIIFGIMAKDIYRGNKNREKQLTMETVTSIKDTFEREIDVAYLKELEMEKSHEAKKSGLIDFIERDLSFLASHPEYNFDSEEMSALAQEYSYDYWASPITDSEKADYIESFLMLEAEMYRRNPYVGMMSGTPHIGFEYFYEVFEYLGWSKEEVREDDFIREVRSVMRTVIENPYEGCEVELVTLISLATDYARMVGLGSANSDDDGTKSLVADVNKILDNIFEVISQKIVAAKNLEKQAEAVFEQEKSVEQKGGSLAQDTSVKKIDFKPAPGKF